MIRAYIGLGSNLADPVAQVRAALRALTALPHSRLAGQSPLYRSAPVGPQDQPDFINAVAALDTSLPPLALLDALQALEQAAGRERLRPWGERTLDLDLLLYGDQHIATPRLTVPHPHLHERAFVLVPLAALAPDLRLPDGQPITHWLAQCNRDDVWYYDGRVDGRDSPGGGRG
ncbi:2-amino-4-hydroxy-6-hydroxymethyldihydropteridine diphosphokinase [Alcanivorax quisquiliarum]|uniref:2-amino-4-hydroxy-6-hydroxymethyldihydropteridine pyrophosphokinase n=1 Tax=Alcanivorax quisquiliarum TaxID=2933565 RepID=A0ABT0E7Z7_9GAMM|nr:2-amino-4-hydroxy-6-hydroxymethyldihydropteridine diphosphokinase [Alcanivorax quisquiliarum]MCK0537967.1 2-amino-4-hydroxy-6-hydroxymethyldihydropteridine diphosphokinase [Alcanivorax quisquiliarum]